jgi:hypothetical protein
MPVKYSGPARTKLWASGRVSFDSVKRHPAPFNRVYRAVSKGSLRFRFASFLVGGKILPPKAPSNTFAELKSSHLSGRNPSFHRQRHVF